MRDTLSTALASVDAAACEAYQRSGPLLVAYADREMAGRADLGELLGPCPPEVLFRAHADHIPFMVAQLRMRDADALLAILTWVYETHQLRGIDLRAFPINLDIWRAGVEQYLPQPAAAQIAAVYRCLSELHGELVRRAQISGGGPGVADDLRPHYDRYLQALLAPDMRAALRAATAYIDAPERIGIWWEGVIHPTLYEIGHRWAQGQISVGQEHMATAITQRVMAYFYPQILDVSRQRGRVVVASSPGELHEIGARIISDLLELSGWDTYFTGANTPAESITGLLAQTRADFLCISTTLYASLPAVTSLIARVRSAGLSPTPQIVVGGQAYTTSPDLWRQVGADALARSASECVAHFEATRP
jgi:methanogenic corrinoid protein MtbC1